MIYFQLEENTDYKKTAHFGAQVSNECSQVKDSDIQKALSWVSNPCVFYSQRQLYYSAEEHGVTDTSTEITNLVNFK